MSHTFRWGILSAVTATLIWSWNFIIARSVIDTIPPVTLAFLRWSTATLLLLPFTLQPLKSAWPLVKQHLFYLAITALLGVTLFNTLIYIGSQTTSALNLSLIAISFPIFILLFSALFLGDTITSRRMAGVVVVLSSILFLISGGDLQKLLSIEASIGDLWMLLAAIIFAVYSILIRRKPQTLNSHAFLIYTFLIGWVLLVPWVVWEQQGMAWPTITLQSSGAILYLGLFTSIISYFLWNHAVASIGPANAGMIYYTLPLFSGIEAWLVLGEPITSIHLLSAAGILGGIYLSTERH